MPARALRAGLLRKGGINGAPDATRGQARCPDPWLMTITGFPGRVRRGSGEGRELPRARARLAALAVLLALAASGCADGGIPRGHALAAGYAGGMGLSAVRLGGKFGYLDEVLRNTSSSPITLSSITFPGAGKLLRTMQVKIGLIAPGVPGLPGARYETDPPVQRSGTGASSNPCAQCRACGSPRTAWRGSGWCSRPSAPAATRSPSTFVAYTQNGVRYRQALPQGYEGVVTRNGTRLVPASDERPCLSLTTSLDR
jgi:hypothetical protein